MTLGEQGYLLLTSRLGDVDCKPLTLSQLDKLAAAIRRMPQPAEDRELEIRDLLSAGLNESFSQRVLVLLDREPLLRQYLKRAKSAGCSPLTKISEAYPKRLLSRLGKHAPASLWGKGDVSLLQRPCVGLVGSRDLRPDNLRFAYEVGKQAALQGYVLVSGDARGADSVAQKACLEHGGYVISILPGETDKQVADKRVLYLSEDGFDIPFTSARALQRNRIIHALGEKTFVAQCALGKGGTWDGTRNNLQKRLSPVWCYNDGSEGTKELACLGAELISMRQLGDFSRLQEKELNFMDADR